MFLTAPIYILILIQAPGTLTLTALGKYGGFDILLKRTEGRYIDGWISYSFNSAMYREPGSPDDPDTYIDVGNAVSNNWYYPSFHRFHTLNLIMNIKVTRKFTITTRFGLASGVPLERVVVDKQPYSVAVLDESGAQINTIQEWRQITRRDTSNRTDFSIPMDIKFSFFSFNLTGKGRQEFYVAIENVFSLIHTPRGSVAFNRYTGEEEDGSMGASFDIPMPIPSFGFKWSY
jgi:hypothetical protein